MNRLFYSLCFLCILLFPLRGQEGRSAGAYSERVFGPRGRAEAYSAGAFRGRVVGIEGDGAFDDVEVILGRSASSLTGDDLRTAEPDSTGWFQFTNLPDGIWWAKVRKPGYQGPPAREVRLANGMPVEPATDESRQFLLVDIDSNTFTFHWEEDQTTAGYEYAAHVNEPLVVEFQGAPVEVLNNSSAIRLERDYGILLANSPAGPAWTQEHAYRLLETLKTIPYYWETGTSQWTLASGHVENDIWITGGGIESERRVQVAAEAFANASPRIATVDGKRGRYFSKRLHHAAVRFATDQGRDERAYENILQDRYGVTMDITSHTTYRELTAGTTGESASRFQAFHAEEIIQIINTLEEMPPGMRATPGLRYLVRRRDGHSHPTYPGVPAVAWTGSRYIEFMEKAFTQDSILGIHRLILHEKAHFLWAHVFDATTKADWVTLGGWFEAPQSPSGWWTSKQTEFVSAYAHLKNPNEDMAESIAYFVVNPDKLRSRAIGKYEFVRDRIMQGSFYISTIREDLTFPVYNLYPDYVFPGKIRRVDIQITGAPEEDKNVRIEIELHAQDAILEGAVHAFTRIYSENGTSIDFYMYPRDSDGWRTNTPGTVLSRSFTISKHVKSGNWIPHQISLTDANGNTRLTSLNDFGWQFHVNNPLEDVTPPSYVPNSISLTTSSATLEGREVQIIEATWRVVEEDSGIEDCAGNMIIKVPGTSAYSQHGYSYRFGLEFPYRFDPQESLCKAWRIVPHYMPSGRYYVVSIDMRDVAGHTTTVKFSHSRNSAEDPYSVDEPSPWIDLTTNHPDYAPPELNLNTIKISATPTNPADPNGETLVTLQFDMRDDISGLSSGSLYLRDPQGIEHYHGIYRPAHEGVWFPASDPSEWTRYTWTTLLPIGSAPGIWGLSEMALEDRAKNFSRYDFTEIMHFVVE